MSKSTRTGREPTDPTPAQIRRRCERIQSGWNPRERAKRAMSKPAPWLPPSVQVEEILEASLPGVYADQN
jgi:hypothetical protein